MPFFARPNLDDTQFKQLPSSQLSLSGQTRILTTSGLTLAGGGGENVLITTCDAATHVGHVMTLTCIGTEKIVQLMPSGAGGDQYYNPPYKSPAAISLGGVSAGTQLTGKTLSCIIETLLVPTLQPTATQPSFSYDISPSTTLYEVGCTIPTISSINGNFSKGTVSPLYFGTPNCRSGIANSYNYNVFGVSVSSPTPNTLLATNYVINVGSNTISGCVAYAAGPTIKDSVGNNATGPTVTPNPLSAGNTPAVIKTLTGIYPYFYGKIASGGAPIGGNRPTINTVCSCIISNDSTRTGVVVADSTSTITITWGSTSDDYIWFATPSASATKTKWQNTVTVVDNGNIGGAVNPGGNLFPDPVTVTPINTICWNNQSYKVYISNYQVTAVYPYELKNS